MALIPFRNLGSVGTVTDVDPLALAPAGWSSSLNMRFADGVISRGPISKRIGTAQTGTPAHLHGTSVPSGGSEILLTHQDGRIVRWSAKGKDGGPGIETDLTPSDHNPAVMVDEPVTVTELQQVIYHNRPDRPLWMMRKAGERFAVAPGWNDEWRCKAVRSLNGQVIALGVHRNGRYYPAMVKWSDFSTFEEPTLTWNAETTNSAGENVLGNLAEKLVDAAELRGRLYLYAEHGVYAMTPLPTNLLYDFQPMIHDKGVISQNCIAVVDNLHYVFGVEQLWCHDGQNPLWTTDGTETRGIFDHLVREASHRFFVFHNRDLNEIMFCHVSTHPDCTFKVGKGFVPNDLDPYPGCNRAAVFHLGSKTWSFYDLPYIIGAAMVTPTTGVRYEELMDQSYEDLMNTSYRDLLDNNPKTAVMVSPVRTLNAEPNPVIRANNDTYTLRRKQR